MTDVLLFIAIVLGAGVLGAVLGWVEYMLVFRPLYRDLERALLEEEDQIHD